MSVPCAARRAALRAWALDRSQTKNAWGRRRAQLWPLTWEEFLGVLDAADRVAAAEAQAASMRARLETIARLGDYGCEAADEAREELALWRLRRTEPPPCEAAP